MVDEYPKTKLERTLSAGKTVLKVGGKALKYHSQKPFMDKEKRRLAKHALDKESAKILFQGLSLLKGTALKIAQMLSLELDVFPASVRQELEKSYNQVPPINRALVRKIITSNLGKAPEEVFQSFDSKAFAAASLGQVHSAVAKSGEHLAIKIQYPGIKDTIQNDIRMVKAVLKPLPEYELILPVLEEIECRLLEETDYVQEAENTLFFKQHMKLKNVSMPDYFPQTSTDKIISLTYMEGLPLNEWLKQSHSQKERNLVAQTLHHIFLHGFYEMNCIHADPNPGNFIIGQDCHIGLLDFGCVKHFNPEFVHLYRQIPETALTGSKVDHMALLKAFQIGGPTVEQEVLKQMTDLTYETGKWFSKLYKEESFDFGANNDFVREGKQMINKVFELRKHFQKMDTNFLYLHRTRYGLVRLFEMMKAKVKIQNKYEWDGDGTLKGN